MTTVTNPNWAGYQITSNTLPFTSAMVTFTVPTIDCKDSNAQASFFVGLGGFKGSQLKQGGVLAGCYLDHTPGYILFKEAPKSAAGGSFSQTVRNHLTVKAGAKMTVSICPIVDKKKDIEGRYTCGEPKQSRQSVTYLIVYKYTNPDGRSNTETTTIDGDAGRADAECIAERPTQSGQLGHYLPLVNFGLAEFSTCGGYVGDVDYFANPTTTDKSYTITKRNIKNWWNGLLAATSSPDQDGSFAVQWRRST